MTETKPDADIVVLSVDLMDRSKITAAFPDAKLVRSIDALLEHGATASLVVIDLARVSDIAVVAQLRENNCRVVGFGSHVDDAVLQHATDAGAEAVPRSVFFRRLATGEL